MLAMYNTCSFSQNMCTYTQVTTCMFGCHGDECHLVGHWWCFGRVHLCSSPRQPDELLCWPEGTILYLPPSSLPLSSSHLFAPFPSSYFLPPSYFRPLLCIHQKYQQPVSKTILHRLGAFKSKGGEEGITHCCASMQPCEYLVCKA